MRDEAGLLLYGVFRTLVARNVPLGVADYLDAIRALQLQHGTSGVQRPPSRESLRRLCQILWSRNVEETRLIDEVFKAIPAPAQADLDQLADLIRERDPETARAFQRGRDTTGVQITEGTRDATVGAPPGPKLAIDVQSARDSGGVPLPYPVIPPDSGETFVMRPQTIVSSRTLAVLWRRYRRMHRTGPATELDVDATIAEQCRRGLIDRPVLRSPRVNRARLLILADVSPSMIVWRPFLDELVQSLTLSRLPGARLLYFSNVPKQSLFRSPALSGSIATKQALAAHRGTSVLVISDAGAARGYFNHTRVEKTRAFVGSVSAGGRSIVWINPMPSSRWAGTTAEPIATSKGATFLPLNVASLIRAVDILRGVKSH